MEFENLSSDVVIWTSGKYYRKKSWTTLLIGIWLGIVWKLCYWLFYRLFCFTNYHHPRHTPPSPPFLPFLLLLFLLLVSLQLCLHAMFCQHLPWLPSANPPPLHFPRYLNPIAPPFSPSLALSPESPSFFRSFSPSLALSPPHSPIPPTVTLTWPSPTPHRASSMWNVI